MAQNISGNRTPDCMYVSCDHTGAAKVCDSATGNTNLDNLKAAWKVLATEYAGLASEVKAEIIGAGDPSGSAIEKALSLYDYVVGKYNKTLKVNEINDFLNRNPAAVSGARIGGSSVTSSTNNIIIIVVAASVLSLTAVSGCLLLRRRKHK